MAAGGGLHVVSWNVASWRTAAGEISRRHGLREWFAALAPDVLCLQEVKISADDVHRDTSLLAAPDGYESFWATNEGKGAQYKGFNGVGAYARDGLVVRAERRPLRDDALDDEGRCMLLELRLRVVIVNAYVPSVSCAGRHALKLRFLDALGALLARERDAGKRVVLAGDLNLTASALDAHWTRTWLDISALSAAARAGSLSAASLWPNAEREVALSERAAEQARQLDVRALALARALGLGFDALRAALESSQVRECRTQNTLTGASFEKHKLFVSVPALVAGGGDAWRPIGWVMDSPEGVRWCFPRELREADGAPGEPTRADAVGGSEGEEEEGAESGVVCAMCRRAGELRLGSLRPLAAAVLAGLGDAFGEVEWARLAASPVFSRESCDALVRARFHALCAAGGGLLDTFRAAHPRAQSRFTAWDQSAQRRFSNVGSRIDFILAPAELLGCAARGEALDTGGSAHEPCSAAAAHCAATAGGRWRAQAYGKAGLVEGEAPSYALHLRQPAHTGIIYTPPSYSDHVAVSALLRGYDLHAAAAEAASEAARGARSVDSGMQPHLRWQGERSFMMAYFRQTAPQGTRAGEGAHGRAKPGGDGEKAKQGAAKKQRRGAGPIDYFVRALR